MKGIWAISALLVASIIAGLPTSCSSSKQDSALDCPSDRPLASLIAGSDYVLVGRVEVGERLSGASQQRQYIDLPIQITDSIKDGPPDVLLVRYYNTESQYRPTSAALTNLEKDQAILFLIQVDGPGSTAGLYFAGNSPDALRPASEASIAATRSEVGRQERLLESWQPDATLQYYNKVRELIASLGNVSGEDQQRVFDSLEGLGADAVPAIVAQMDDRRRLQTQAISLKSPSADSYEAIMHYGPELVVDGLAAILPQITGVSFGARILNGGSARERDAVVAGWRIYASDLNCSSEDR